MSLILSRNLSPTTIGKALSMSLDTSSQTRIDSSIWPADQWQGPVLVVRLSSLGDVVLATSFVDQLRLRRPDLSVDFLTRRPFDTLLRGLVGINNVITETDTNAKPVNYQLVIDLQGGKKGAQACKLFAPGARRLTYNRAALRRRLLVLSGNRISAPKPLVVRFAHLLAGRDLDVNQIQSNIAVSQQCQTRLRSELDRYQEPANGWALLSSGASKRLKAIPAYLSAGIANELKALGWGIIELKPPSSDCPAGLSAAESSSVSQTSQIEPGKNDHLSFSGDLSEVSALLSLVRIVISSDSGILHIAAAVKTPAIALFGPTVPKLGFSPLGKSRVLGVDLPCRPCHIHGPAFCWMRHEKCWSALDVKRIVSEVNILFSG